MMDSKVWMIFDIDVDVSLESVNGIKISKLDLMNLIVKWEC